MQQPKAAAALLTTGDVAKVAGVAPETVRAWERANKLPAVRTVGGQRLFRREEVDAFLASREVDQAEKEMNR